LFDADGVFIGNGLSAEFRGKIHKGNSAPSSSPTRNTPVSSPKTGSPAGSPPSSPPPLRKGSYFK